MTPAKPSTAKPHSAKPLRSLASACCSLALLLLAALAAAPAGAVVFDSPAVDAAAGSTAADADALLTTFTLAVGFPDAQAGSDRGVLIVPGTVIPLGGVEDRPAAQELADRGASLSQLAGRLQETLRLEQIDVRYQTRERLTVDQAVELPPVGPGSDLRPRATLVGFSDQLATYRVAFHRGPVVLADTNVTIPSGQRSVVGGVDGDEAPYLFLVVEPAGTEPRHLEDLENVTPPQALSKMAPQYTEETREDRIEGVVILQAVIDTDGTVREVEVLRSLHPDLDQASLDAVRQWTFEPARLDGRPVAVYYNLTINFRLE